MSELELLEITEEMKRKSLALQAKLRADPNHKDSPRTPIDFSRIEPTDHSKEE